MITLAKDLVKTVTKKDIIDFLESYISESIERSSLEGRTEMCASGYNISVNPKTGKMERGLHNRDKIEDYVWQWKGIRDYLDEIVADFRRAGYRVYDKNHNGSIWINWE